MLILLRLQVCTTDCIGTIKVCVIVCTNLCTIFKTLDI